MSSSLQQINISYIPAEDRLLLKVSVSGNSEYRLWLTRRFTGLLLQVLDKQMESYGGAAELASGEETRQHFKGGAFNQTYTPLNSPHFPLGENGILAFRINTRQTEQGQLNLQLLPEAGEGINFTLDKSMLYLLHNLLEQGLGATDWQLTQAPAINTLH
ncbi:MAG: hypothetical protein RQ899_10120 [Pseudomonadales bacterium]|nr:hypothetical protein [Pseudomonadales bacterium]